jgi:hypothetical protein
MAVKLKIEKRGDEILIVHCTKVWLQLAQWFLRRKFKCESLRRTMDGQKLTWPLAR